MEVGGNVVNFAVQDGPSIVFRVVLADFVTCDASQSTITLGQILGRLYQPVPVLHPKPLAHAVLSSWILASLCATTATPRCCPCRLGLASRRRRHCRVIHTPCHILFLLRQRHGRQQATTTFGFFQLRKNNKEFVLDTSAVSPSLGFPTTHNTTNNGH